MATPDQKLHKAVRENDIKLVETFLNSGVDINCLFYGWTPLQLAIENGLQEMAVYLITKGCDPKQHDKNTKSPFEESVLKKEAKVVEALVSHGVSASQSLSTGDSALCFAVELGCVELVKALLNGNADPNSVNKRNESAVYIACQEGEVDILKELLKKGADVNMIIRENNNFTPLIAAVASDNEDIVKVLLQNKACVNAQDSDGWTPLWHAYSNSNEDISEILLRAGAQMDITNNEGKTVLQEANENEDDDFIDLFNKFKGVI
ncbi:ankyrin repeat-containing protein [Elysia marginata]|uniref:Ankyrin repeat-containing protein n=1 Tax=Elysia marginata TaxID=1093978 RepID=A0AAV4JII3_9GAST|nr:ankyrin repeat-containing protein [Elysia marginata]